ncbi:unnamed protein product [Rhizoctonia solani]|uniref:Inhibitor I9 domain-containing protein n=1 Tax=Rhizoctonia solani TaxID=456999 RepID=A0A8H3A4R7_9AGAM|nr:unnamed protein product [Rhizoctonia solani]
MKCYIVTFKESATNEQIDNYINQAKNHGGGIKHDYRSLIKMVAVWLPDQLIEKSSHDPIVDAIEPDSRVETQKTEVTRVANHLLHDAEATFAICMNSQVIREFTNCVQLLKLTRR